MAPKLTLRENESPTKEVVSSLFMGQKLWEVSGHHPVHSPGTSSTVCWNGPPGRTECAHGNSFSLISNFWIFSLISRLGVCCSHEGKHGGREFSYFQFAQIQTNGFEGKMASSYKIPMWTKLWESTSSKQCLRPKSFILTCWRCRKG